MDKKTIVKIQELRNEGDSFGTIAKKLLITKSQAKYYSDFDLENYDKKQKYINAVCELAKKCTNINQILKILGKKGTNEYYKQIKRILDENNIDISHFTHNDEFKPSGIKEKKSLPDYLVVGSTIAISKLRYKLIKEGVKEHKCERCGRTEWEGEIIPLQLHHMNGDRTDNRLENLQLLCPNCHALTDNYCGKNKQTNKNCCEICGKEIKTSSKYCEDCYHRHIQTRNGFVETPEKLQLINDFKCLGSFRGICRKYLVSHKKVENWFSFYGLPSSSLLMRKYIKENVDNTVKWKFSNGNSKTLREYQKKNFRVLDRIGETGEIEKRYTSVKELVDDGFDPKNVYRVCRGELKTHHKKVFKYV